MPKIAVIGLPGKWSSEILADAVEAATGSRLLVDMSEVVTDFTNKTISFRGENLCDYDALIIKKISAEYNPNTLDRLEVLRLAEAQDVQIFSPPLNILRLIDRLSCTTTLRMHDVPMPDTTITEDCMEALTAVQEYGSAVFKPLYSTKARGMILLDAEEGEAVLREKIAAYQAEHSCCYIQKKIDLSGKDLGMVFLGGEYLGCYARVAQSGSWNTTINSGGRYEAYEANNELIAMAEAAQAPFGLDFTTVDVALCPEGPFVFEVSAFGGFRGVQAGLGINAAERYVEHILKKLG